MSYKYKYKDKFLKPLDITTDTFIKEFTKKYIESESFFDKLIQGSDGIYSNPKWEVSAASSTKENESDHIIQTHDYIKMMIDSVNLKKAEQEVKYAVPEDKEFIFDPKELDI